MCRSVRWDLLRMLVGALALSLASQVTQAQPPNDDCASATAVTVLPFVGVVDPSLATNEPLDPPQPGCGFGVLPRSVWYELTVPEAGTYQVHNYGSDYGTVLSVFDGSCAGMLEIACDYSPFGPASNPSRSVNSFQAMTAGQTFLILVTEMPNPMIPSPSVTRVGIDKVATLERVAVSSDSDPLGGQFGKVSGPVISKRDQVSFEGHTDGIFAVDAAGVLTTLVASGDPAPLGVGGTFGRLSAPAFNDLGDAYFRAFIEGGAVRSGIFLWSTGLVSAVVLEGDVSPIGIPYTSFGDHVDSSLNGDLVFRAYAPPFDGLYYFAAGSMSLVALEGTADPCAAGETLDMRRQEAHLLTDLVEVVFVDTDGTEGIYLAMPGQPITALACEGDPAPGGGTFDRFAQEFAVDDQSLSSVAFQARITGGPQSRGLFMVSSTYCPMGSPCALAMQGDPAPSGGAFGGFSSRMRPDFTSTGGLVFHAPTTSDDGIYRYEAAGISTIATVGGPCPIGGAGSVDRLGVAVTYDSSTDDAIFEAACSDGTGLMRQAVGAAGSEVASRDDVTAIGNGFEFTEPVANVGDVAFHGRRDAIFTRDCTGIPCGAIDVVAAPQDIVGGLTVTRIDEILHNTLTAAGNRVAFVAETFGPSRRDAILMANPNWNFSVVAVGDPVPGMAQTFGELRFPNTLLGTHVRPSMDQKNVTFVADLAPSLDSGVFLWNSNGMAVVALSGTPAPGGGDFIDFTIPDVRDGYIAFAGTTTAGAQCVYRYEIITALLEEVACAGDPVGAPIGGTIDDFTSPPVVSDYKRVAFRADVTGGASDDCLITTRGPMTVEPVKCIDDPLPIGAEIDNLDALTNTDFNYVDRRLAYYVRTSNVEENVLFFTDVAAGIDSTKVAGYAEQAPGGGRFDLFGFDSDIQVSSNDEFVVFDTHLSGADVGYAIIRGE